MKNIVILAAVVLSVYGCGGSDSESSNISSFNYDCAIESNDIQGCWVSSKCATGDSEDFSSKLIFEMSSGNLMRKAAIFANSNCSGSQELNPFGDAGLTYSFDSVVISSAGLETDLYSIAGGYTLVSIESDVMCFSEGFYSVTSTHDLEFVSKEEVSQTVNFEDCFERI